MDQDHQVLGQKSNNVNKLFKSFCFKEMMHMKPIFFSKNSPHLLYFEWTSPWHVKTATVRGHHHQLCILRLQGIQSPPLPGSKLTHGRWRMRWASSWAKSLAQYWWQSNSWKNNGTRQPVWSFNQGDLSKYGSKKRFLKRLICNPLIIKALLHGKGWYWRGGHP